jgi:hypothetical protein
MAAIKSSHHVLRVMAHAPPAALAGQQAGAACG